MLEIQTLVWAAGTLHTQGASAASSVSHCKCLNSQGWLLQKMPLCPHDQTEMNLPMHDNSTTSYNFLNILLYSSNQMAPQTGASQGEP